MTIQVELEQEESQRVLDALRAYAVPRATYDTVEKIVLALADRDGHQQEILAALRAFARVRKGAWIRGAPSHVLAEFLTQLEKDGWRLVPVEPVPLPGSEEE